MFIKLDDSMNLAITVNEPLYRGDNLNRKIIYLLPFIIGEVDLLTATVYLSYIRADGIADIVALERMDESYNTTYYQYTMPVTCKLTKYPGEICTWMQIYSGTPSNPTIAKSSECMLYVQESKNMDDYLCDHQTTAIYQLQKEVDSISEIIPEKADDISYDIENNMLQLTSGGNLIGTPVDMNEAVSDATEDSGINDVIDFDDEEDTDDDTAVNAIIEF